MKAKFYKIIAVITVIVKVCERQQSSDEQYSGNVDNSSNIQNPVQNIVNQNSEKM